MPTRYTPLAPIYAINEPFFNVKNEEFAGGAKGDGSTDDTAAITAAINAAHSAGGGTVLFPEGTYLTGNQTLYAKVHLRGIGIDATTIKLKNGANADIFSAQTGSINLSAADGAGSAGSLYNFGLYDLTLDGNKANQSSGTSYPLRFYGYGYIVQNVRVKNGYSGGVLSDWNGGAATPGNDAMEAQWDNVKIHDCNGMGLQIGGPHDSQFMNLKVYNCGTNCIHVAPNATALQFTNTHCWNIGSGVNACGFLIEAGYTLMYNCESEKTDGMSVALLAGDNVWDGHIFDASSTNSSNGIQIGLQSGQTPYAGMIQQSGGVTLAKQVSDNIVRGNFDYCGLSHGSIWFANSGGNNMVLATVYQTSGSGITGTPSSQDNFWIYVKGLSNDGSLGHCGGFQMASGATSGFFLADASGNQSFKIYATGSGGGGFYFGAGNPLRGYSDNFLSTQTWAINSSDGSIQPGTASGPGGAIRSGSGAPSNSLGGNGDCYLRTDTPGTANQRIYVKSSGSWIGIV